MDRKLETCKTCGVEVHVDKHGLRWNPEKIGRIHNCKLKRRPMRAKKSKPEQLSLLDWKPAWKE